MASGKGGSKTKAQRKWRQRRAEVKSMEMAPRKGERENKAQRKWRHEKGGSERNGAPEMA